MKFNKEAHRLYVSVAVVPVRSTIVNFRIDGREGDYRVDRTGFGAQWWEAIDGGVPFRTLTAAKAYLDLWMREAALQESLNPNTGRANGADRCAACGDSFGVHGFRVTAFGSRVCGPCVRLARSAS